MNHFLSDSEISALIIKAKAGDNAAWKAICENFDRYIHKCAWRRLKKAGMTDDYRLELEEDLYMAGWQGFVSAIRNYDSAHGQILTYATHYIDGEIAKEMDLLLNPLGLTERPETEEDKEKSVKISKISLDVCPNKTSVFHMPNKPFTIPESPEREKYSAERRTLQILKVLHILTDEDHAISKDELGRMLRLYRMAKYDNGTPLESPNTFTSTMESILQELNPMEYSEEKDAKYKIRYEGYKEDRLKKRLNKEGGKKAADITGFSYIHTFDKDELDKLLQLICFSDMLSSGEKSVLISKLVGTASTYYSSPFWDGEKIKFNPKAIYGRFSSGRQEEKEKLSKNLKIIQQAVNSMGQIRFKFNRYTAKHTMIAKSNYLHTLSPYHLVVYHDNYYCIGLKKDDKRIWHYRVDLMSEVEIVRDADGKIVPIEVCPFEGLPITNAYWNPEKYMAEHLNMAFDEPQDIRIKIRNTDYTIIHDWFGDYYEKTDEACGDGYDIVKVRTSPFMIVRWALQYGDAVEIMDEEIQEKIREELNSMGEKYGI